jgi:xanthine/uracil permease
MLIGELRQISVDSVVLLFKKIDTNFLDTRITYYPILVAGVIATILAFLFAPDVTSEMDDAVAVEVRPPVLLGGLEKGQVE